MGVPTCEVGLVDGFTGVVLALVVATEGDPFDLAGEPKGDFNNGELRPLGRVSAEDRSDASLVGLTTLVFFFDSFGIGGEEHVVASVATEETTGWLARGRVRGVSLLARFDVVAAAMGPLSDLFMVEESSCVSPSFWSEREG